MVLHCLFQHSFGLALLDRAAGCPGHTVYESNGAVRWEGKGRHSLYAANHLTLAMFLVADRRGLHLQPAPVLSAGML